MQKFCFTRWHEYTKSLIWKFQLHLHKQYVFFRALPVYQPAESILRKYKFNITRSSVKKHETLLKKKKNVQLRGTARCERAEACFSAMPVARNARLARCLIKSVAIVNKSVRKPPLNIHTQNSELHKNYDTRCAALPIVFYVRACVPFLSVIYRCTSRPRRKNIETIRK